MPIEIIELVVKATVMEETSQSGSNATPVAHKVNKQEIIKECVEQVLQILKEKEER